MQADLARLVRIPSVSRPGSDPAHLRAAAAASAEILAQAGCVDVRYLEIDDAPPAVFATCNVVAPGPSVLLYAHYDVQPPGPSELWAALPFEPTLRDGRLYGRGAADDKAGIITHAEAIRAFGGQPPGRVRVLLEGEEETGSPHLGRFLKRFGAELRSDVIVLADNPNWRLGVPTLTTSLRGLVECLVELRVLHHAVHSGEYGGPVIDAVTSLARLLASLHNDDGTPAVRGLLSADDPPLEMTEDEFRGNAGVLSGVHLAGAGSMTARLWARPSIAVLGIDAPRVSEASNQLVASARALISVRVAPTDQPARALRVLGEHLRSHAPWGAELRLTEGHQTMGPGVRIEARGPAFDAARQALAKAWGADVVEAGGGGSIPIVTELAAAFPDASLLLTGAADPASQLHAENESVDLVELRRATLAEALLLQSLAESGLNSRLGVAGAET
ncbi:MAG: M20/M25/M40 family metallo-hydrolase [Chloroflexi bacterium]|nr:M20/M25/M40 family metallo-hydrolase [Chloroflexota bacterium]